jgi:hypothetical protein
MGVWPPQEFLFMDLSIPVSARRCAAALGVIVGLLIAASLGATLLSFVDIEQPFLREMKESLVRLTWVDEEANLPAWFSASLLLLCALLMAVITSLVRQQGGGQVAGWLVLTLIFLFLSLDEIAQLHELSITPLRDRFGATGFLYYAWIVPAALCVILFVLGYLRFLGRLPARTRRLFLLAGAIYVGGAIGVEAVSGQQASLYGERNLTYHVIITLEELLEMTGLVVFVFALLDYIGHQFTRITFHVTTRA